MWNRTNRTETRRFGGAVALMVFAFAGAVGAQPKVKEVPRGVAAGQQPSHLRVYYDDASGRVVELRPNQSLPLGERREFQIWLEAWDARGKQMPQSQLKYQVATDNHCAGRYTIEGLTPHRFRVRVLRDDLSGCGLYARLISPTTLERPLKLAWTLGAGVGASYGRTEAEFVVDRLYRALLRRGPDREGFYTAVQRVDAGRVAEVVEQMFASEEFRTTYRGVTTAQLLDGIYRGLLGRAPDASAAPYQARLANATDRVRVVLEILSSREFQSLLDRNVVAGNPCASGGDPAPCDVKIFYERGDGRTVALTSDQKLDLGYDDSTQIWLETVDQYGREYRGENSGFRVLSSRDCEDELDVHPLASNRYALRVLDRDAGQCRLVVRLDGPRQVDRALDLQWQGGYGYGYDGYDRYGATYERDDAEYIVDRLYRSLLQRPPSQADFQANVGRVEDGQLRLVVDELTSSPEFLNRERSRTSDVVLQDLYRGLLQRSPASGESSVSRLGTADYLAIVLQLLSSPEFRQLLERR
jgi:hypothetical protein